MSNKDNFVRLTVDVAARPERAFHIFTTQFDRIKPHDHNLLSVEIAETVFEARVGGFVYDRGVDGTVCRWARVLAYDPPNRIVISWDIGPRWQIETDPARTSEVEIRFTAQGAGRTRIDLEHRHIDRHGDGWEAVREGVGHEGGWALYLKRFDGIVTSHDAVKNRQGVAE